MPMAAVLLVTIIGVFYFGIFSDSIIERFSQSPTTATMQAER
jgi:hypothetical protein